MHGNVFEWTHDWKGEYGETAVVDPIGAKLGVDRLYRGGCWLNDASFCRAAFRGTGPPLYRTTYIGFRVVLSSSSVHSSEADK